MNVALTLALALAMAAVAIVNTALMAWLWRFPMAPDPTGRNPHGVSTAPRSWTNVHRGLGYGFALLYLALLTEMLPRAWTFREATTISVVHGALGLLVGVILAAKILILRRYRQYEPRMPWIGGALAATTLVVAALGAVPAWRVTQPLTPLPDPLDRGRDLVGVRCVQCHGASRFAWEDEEAREWDEITEEMQRNAERTPGKTPITEEERRLITAYLARLLGEEGNGDDGEAREEDEAEAEEEEADDGGRRRRRRGRDH
ncbi:MAG TPA: hypothetical protein VD962_08605 [Rubricoccaceae bacterium]|nr:hypothetical protein [Rubricoccaceae bacterium]